MRKSFKNRHNSRKLVMIVLVVLLFISVAYATISTTLKMTGTITAKKQNYSVYWANPVVTNGSVTTALPTIEDFGGQANTKATFNVTFDLPGEFYEFTIDAVNNGTIDVVVSDVDIELPDNLPDYIVVSATYADGSEIEVGKTLAKKNGNTPTTEKYKVRVEFDKSLATSEDINNIPNNGLNLSFAIGVEYSTIDEINITNGTMLYAAYTGDPEGRSQYYVNIGDTLPLEFSSSGDTLTSDYFGGPTPDYRKIRFAYKRYVGYDVGSENYANYDHSTFACWRAWGPSKIYYYDVCYIDRTISYNPKIFYGFVIDENREVLNKYICTSYKGKKECFEVVRDDDYYEYKNLDSKEDVWTKLVRLYGEGNSSSGGCWESNSGNYDYECLSSDKTVYVSYTEGKVPNISVKDSKNKAYYCYMPDEDYIHGPNDIQNINNGGSPCWARYLED